LKGYLRYFSTKLIWFFVTLIAAFLLNFFLPRMMPGDPVAAIVARMAQGQSNATGVQAIYRQYTELFHTNEPMLTQFLIYIRNVLHGAIRLHLVDHRLAAARHYRRLFYW
jgi:peptide/nickel transport system permease protein